MGEQYIDLFTAGAYALSGRIFAAVAQPGIGWIFYFLAAAGLIFAVVQSAVGQRPQFWQQHLVAVCLASVLTLVPQSIDITQLTYGAPGRIESVFGTHHGAAPHLTYWIERLGAAAATALRSLTHANASLMVPGVAMQVADIVTDPATINDSQVRANLEIWRRRIVPKILADRPALALKIRSQQLDAALLNPAPAAPQWVGNTAAAGAQAVRAALAAQDIDLHALVQSQSAMLNQIAADAGAAAWNAEAQGSATSIPLVLPVPMPAPRQAGTFSPAYDDAVQRGDRLLQDLRAQLPASATVHPAAVGGIDELYDLLGRSVFYSAGAGMARDPAVRATIGSLCQRSGDAVCHASMAPLLEAASKLRVVEADRYNSASWTTWFKQPVTSLLLTVTSTLLVTLSSLVVSVLPFAMGVAKSMAILISIVGTWMLLWPGRARIALSWMVGPISFVSLWGILFNIWGDIEPALMQVAWSVNDADYGSWSATRLMSIAVSLGYMGLPSLALGVVYGESGRALYHASARLETALMMAWHTRGAALAFARRWVVNSPMMRRLNQRAYRAVGMGPLRAGTGSRAASRTPASRAPKRPGVAPNPMNLRTPVVQSGTGETSGTASAARAAQVPLPQAGKESRSDPPPRASRPRKPRIGNE